MTSEEVPASASERTALGASESPELAAVALKAPNALGLYDMVGNCAEHALDMGDLFADAAYYRLTRKEAESRYSQMREAVLAPVRNTRSRRRRPVRGTSS